VRQGPLLVEVLAAQRGDSLHTFDRVLRRPIGLAVIYHVAKSRRNLSETQRKLHFDSKGSLIETLQKEMTS
jgi:hypothetical protein